MEPDCPPDVNTFVNTCSFGVPGIGTDALHLNGETT
jgi:hypothetical protein